MNIKFGKVSCTHSVRVVFGYRITSLSHRLLTVFDKCVFILRIELEKARVYSHPKMRVMLYGELQIHSENILRKI